MNSLWIFLFFPFASPCKNTMYQNNLNTKCIKYYWFINPETWSRTLLEGDFLCWNLLYLHFTLRIQYINQYTLMEKTGPLQSCMNINHDSVKSKCWIYNNGMLLLVIACCRQAWALFPSLTIKLLNQTTIEQNTLTRITDLYFGANPYLAIVYDKCWLTSWANYKYKRINTTTIMALFYLLAYVI